MNYYGSSKSSGSISEGSGSVSGFGSISDGSGSGSTSGGAVLSITGISIIAANEEGYSTVSFSVTNLTETPFELIDVWDLEVTLTIYTQLPVTLYPDIPQVINMRTEVGQTFSGTTITVLTEAGDVSYVLP